MNDIYKRIKENQSMFTKGFKKVATTLINDPKYIAMKSATEVGKNWSKRNNYYTF